MADSYLDLKKIEAYGNGCDKWECANNPYYPEADTYCEMCAEERGIDDD